jgi:hypothetical protein
LAQLNQRIGDLALLLENSLVLFSNLRVELEFFDGDLFHAQRVLFGDFQIKV